MDKFPSCVIEWVKTMTVESPSGRCCCKVAVGLVLAASGFAVYRFVMNRPRKSPIKRDYKEGMVYLYQLHRVRGIPNLSPFCLKLETWLRMAKIPYEIPECSIFTRSCEGTLPFLEYNGKEYPDSALAIRDMTAIFDKKYLEEHLTPEQRAIERAFEEMTENSLIVTGAIMRFAEAYDENFNLVFPNMHKMLAWVARKIGKTIFVEPLLKRLKGTFVGKHSRSEMLNIAHEDLRAISVYLGTKKFFHGNQPSRVDATLFGCLAQLVYAPVDIPHKEFITGDLMNLRYYCNRMKERFWPDWDELTNPKQ